jgi:hypothetical protein
MGESKLVDLLKGKDWSSISIFKAKFTELLKTYFYVGGKPELPLTAFEEWSVFKLYLVDVGLLSAMCDLCIDRAICFSATPCIRS